MALGCAVSEGSYASLSSQACREKIKLSWGKRSGRKDPLGVGWGCEKEMKGLRGAPADSESWRKCLECGVWNIFRFIWSLAER